MARALTTVIRTWLYAMLVASFGFLILEISYQSFAVLANDHRVAGLFLAFAFLLGLLATHAVFMLTRRRTLGLFAANLVMVLLQIFLGARVFADSQGWALGLSVAAGVMIGLPAGVILAIADLATTRKQSKEAGGQDIDKRGT